MRFCWSRATVCDICKVQFVVKLRLHMCAVQSIELGRVSSMQVNHKPVEKALKGQDVCIKIDPVPGEAPKMYGRHFEHTDLLVSKVKPDVLCISRRWSRVKCGLRICGSYDGLKCRYWCGQHLDHNHNYRYPVLTIFHPLCYSQSADSGDRNEFESGGGYRSGAKCREKKS